MLAKEFIQCCGDAAGNIIHTSDANPSSCCMLLCVAVYGTAVGLGADVSKRQTIC